MQRLYWKKGDLMRGLAVKRFQEMAEIIIGDVNWLEENGTKSGNDGFFGEDSDTLARLVQKKLKDDDHYKGKIDGDVGDGTWGAMFEALGKTESGANTYERDGVTVVDGRKVWVPKKQFQGTMRSWTDKESRNRIRGVMLHQTGCWMSEKDATWNSIAAHCGITRKGKVVLMFPFEMLIWHGHDLSRQTVGIEIAGLFKGVENSTNTWWPREHTPHRLTDDQVKAANVLLTTIKEEFEAKNGTFDYIYAHRQSDDMRMSDPGEAVWKKVALPWMEKLGATAGEPGYTTGDGFPICKEWDSSAAKGFWRR